MAVGMFMDWSGVTPEQYDEVRGSVDWEGDTPTGALFHAATFDQQGAHIFDMWESAADFQRFVEERLTPGTQAAGLVGEPQVRIFEIHATFTPAFEPV
jgi:hypothetical protein